MNKKKIIATASAVALAAVLAFGGTLAYYQDDADEDVSNTWVDQGNSVSISETDEDGNTTQSNTYSIIPGTTDKKDPVVTAEYTLDSYVYVTVDDTTGELIDWDPASAWSLLSGYDDVYYLLLKTISYDESSGWMDNNDNTYSCIEDDLTYTYKGTTEDVGSYTVSKDSVEIYTYTTQAVGSTTLYTASIPVIDGDTITYSSEITNDTFEGYGTTVALTFDAYIIQACLDGDEEYGESEYSEPGDAYYYVDPEGYYEAAVADGGVAAINATIYKSLTAALSAVADGETVTLLTNIAESSAVTYSDSDKSITLDLNGYTITNSSTSDSYVITVSAGSLTITDSGTGGAIAGNSTSQTGILVSGGTLTVSGGTVSGCAGILVSGGTLTVTGGTVTGLSENYETMTVYFTGESSNVTAYKDRLSSSEGAYAVNGSGIIAVAGYDANLTVNISGGKITTENHGDNYDICVVQVTDKSESNYGVTINVTGGTFGGEVGDMENIYLACDWDYDGEEDEDGAYEYSWITLTGENYLLGGVVGKYYSGTWTCSVNGFSPY